MQYTSQNRMVLAVLLASYLRAKCAWIRLNQAGNHGLLVRAKHMIDNRLKPDALKFFEQRRTTDTHPRHVVYHLTLVSLLLDTLIVAPPIPITIHQ